MSKERKNLLILGAGGHAKVVADCAIAAGWSGVAFLDDRYPELARVGDWPVLGKVDLTNPALAGYSAIALGVGNNRLRLQWLEHGLASGFVFPPIIHPRSVVSPFAVVAEGTVVFAAAVVNIHASVGRACIVNTGAIIEHDCVIAEGCHISPSACLAGEVGLGKFVWIGMGARVIQCLDIGEGATVGAGAVVIQNVDANKTVVGIPAKVKK